MGIGSSRYSEQPQPQVQDGVWVTPELLAQLDGKSIPSPSSHPSSLLVRSPEAITLDAARMMKADAAVQAALQASKYVGDLLLKSGEQELARVKEHADELLKREYSVPTKSVPCASEEERCITCYKQNQQAPTACKEQVNAYMSCAQGAFAEFAARTQ